MALDDSTLMQEVVKITTDGPNPVHYSWRAQIHANGEIIDPLKLLSIDINRDYLDSYGDYILIEVAIGAGTFNFDIFPYKNDLTVTLIREPLGEISEATDLTEDINSQELSATLMDASSAVLEGNSLATQDKEAANLTNILYVKFQLVDLALEQIRMQSVGGIFHATPPGEILRYLLTSISNQVEVDQENKVLGVDLYEPSNTTPVTQAVIPHGTRFTDIADVINAKAAGIYNTGMGFYLQKHLWYIYPLYDLTRFDKALKTITLINIPKDRYPQAERTFRRTQNQLIVMVTGETKHADASESSQLNLGNGIRFVDAGKLLESFATVKDNKATALRVKNVNEFVTQKRDNGLNNVQMSDSRITTNNFVELGKLAARAGSAVQVVWQNSDPGAITPGMPAKYIYLVDDQPVEVTGVVLKAHHYVQTDQPGLTSKRHITNSALLLFINRLMDWSDAGSSTDNA